jgi:large subunit ribosomal protein L30
MILIIRIHGRAEMDRKTEETLIRLNIYRKLTATLINEGDKTQMGMLKKVENYVCYGVVDDEVIKQIIEKRGQTLNGKKINEKDVQKIMDEIKKDNWKIKKFFRLHPPVGGFKKSTKLIFPKGILAKNDEISKLVLRML